METERAWADVKDATKAGERAAAADQTAVIRHRQ
jgi:hypothetical protein